MLNAILNFDGEKEKFKESCTVCYDGCTLLLTSTDASLRMGGLLFDFGIRSDDAWKVDGRYQKTRAMSSCFLGGRWVRICHPTAIQ